MSGRVAEAVAALRRLGPLGLAAALVLLVRPMDRRLEVARPAPRVVSAVPSLGDSLERGPLRGWQRAAEGWLLRFQPDHGAWLVGLWVADAGGPSTMRIEVASWLPGARLSGKAAASWGGAGPTVPEERLARRDWMLGGQTLVGALPAGGPLPRSEPSPLGLGNALLAGLLLVGALARRLEPEPAGLVWIGLMAVGCVGLAVLAPSLAPLGGRLYAPEVRPAVTVLAWSAGVVMLLGAVLFAAVTCQPSRSPTSLKLLPWGFLLGLAVGRHEPVVWIAELASLPVALPTFVALALVAGWLAGLAADGLGALLAPLGRLRSAALIACALLLIGGGGPWAGPGLAVVAAAASGRAGSSWMGLAAVAGLLTGSLASVCLWPASQWLAGAMTVVGMAVGLVIRLRAAGFDRAERVQSSG
ncbi:MAG TPA: hypothetical protein PLS53_17240 [Thermoanaerobaculaceae bacterium]|nr:hypothetical protein [Thermoanaerobaculaceae bacterium]HPS79908.1 hypothetical protein [Thermoanaerobaculaceae bacterium]